MSKLPIDSNTKDWIDARASWLLDQFGREFIRSCEIVTPTSDVIPHRFRPIEEDARTLLDRLCNHMRLDSANIELAFYYEGARVDGGATTVGLYEPTGDRYRVWIEAEQLHDPPGLVATMSHELSHVHLLGHGRVTEDADDHEPLTDLLTVFLGLGIFTANAALYDVNQRSGNWEMWQISRRGYLTMPMFGYALALFSHIRDEFRPTWPRYLRPDVRKAFRQSNQYLEEEGFPDLSTVRTTSSRPAFIFQPNEAASESITPTASSEDNSESLCNFCGADLSVGESDGVCLDCHESIEENRREIEEAEQYAEITARHKQVALRLGCGSFIAFCLVLLVLQWLGVIK